MNTSFAISHDETRIAYDVSGEGSAIILLHGGWQTRQKWHAVGYVQQLKDTFKLIAIDIRGNGESDKPTEPTYYTTEKLCQDILAVADSCGIEKFTIWGFSYGANIGRYLAAQSNRVENFIMMDIAFGLGAPGDFRQFIEEFRNHWLPILQAKDQGSLEVTSLSPEDQEAWQESNIAVDVARLSAMLDWGVIEPADVRCRTLWLVGSENDTTMASIREYEEKLKGSMVRVEVIEGSNHREVLTEIDRSLPMMLAFMAHEV